MFRITKIRYDWPEKSGFCVHREHGRPDWTFLHFSTPVRVYLNGCDRPLPPHTCLIYAPGTLQHYYCEEPMLHNWFHFTGDPTALFVKLGIPINEPFHPAAWQFITEIVREMEIEYFAGMPEHEHLLHLKTEELFIQLSRALQDKFFLEINGTDSEKLRRLRTKTVLQLGRRWTVREMAEEVSLSESRFFSLYKAVYGTSPMEDLIHARIDAAKNSLLFTDLAIGDIAETLGYSNASHFSRQFRSCTGISPLQYRKNGQKTK